MMFLLRNFVALAEMSMASKLGLKIFEPKEYQALMNTFCRRPR